MGLCFETTGLRLAIADIVPLRLVSAQVKKSRKYVQIAASIAEVGIIEPPVVARDRSAPGKFLLLDGHLRLEVLRDRGETEVSCLVATDDEAFTYNKHVSRLAAVQEHKMILKAIERGVPEERIARALDIEMSTLKHKKHLLDGICPEAVDMLKDKHVPASTFAILRKMMPMRQIEAVELMEAMNRYTDSYARTLLAATPANQLTEAGRGKALKGLSEDQRLLMERESANLDRDIKAMEQSYGADHLDLVLARGWLGKLLANARVVRYLAQHHPEILGEFQKMTEADHAPA